MGASEFSYRLTLIPDELQGCVNSVFRLVVFAGDPIGLALTGLSLQFIGAAPTVWLYTVALVLLALLNRSLRSVKQ